MLYHYTSGRVLASILSTGEIWMTDPRFLNDAEEVRHGLKVLDHSILASAGESKQSYLDRTCTSEVYERFVERQRQVAASFTDPASASLNNFQKTPFEFSLVFCLTEKRDDLSQWRAYGNGEYAIGFDESELTAAAAAKLTKIKYLGNEADAELVGRINEFFRSKLSYVRDGGVQDGEVFTEGITDVLTPLWRQDYFSRLKHKSFENEAEHRLIRHYSAWEGVVVLQQAGRYPSPLAKVKIFDPIAIGKRNGTCPIKEIVFGPGSDPQLAKDFETAVSKLGYRFKWGKSIAPYRTK